MTVGAVTANGRARVLADGTPMPMLGLGVWQVPNGQECVNAVRWALELGYHHIDTAQAYGNEESVGQALRDSGMPRDEVFITTKFYPGPKPGRRSPAKPATARPQPGQPIPDPLAARRGDPGMAGDGTGSGAWLRPVRRRLQLQR